MSFYRLFLWLFSLSVFFVVGACSETISPREVVAQDGGDPDTGSAKVALSQRIASLQGAMKRESMVGEARWLTDDKYKGRNNNTPESRLVRQRLIEVIKKIGLEPVGKGYEHPFSGKHPGVNVLALLPGKSKKLSKEIIAIGAHYDHLGETSRGIYRGAADNALGVAALLEIARVLKTENFQPSRSILFTFWDCEEDGLAGSIAAIKQPQIDLKTLVIYINLDIVGANLFRGGEKLHFLLGAESGGAPLQEIVQRQVERKSEHIRPLPMSLILGQARSDHVPFLARSVPCLFLSDGTNRDYHTTRDTLARANLSKALAIARLTLALLVELTETTKPPAWNEEGYSGNALNAFGLVEKDLDFLLNIGQMVLDNAAKIGLKSSEVEKIKGLMKRMRDVRQNKTLDKENHLLFLSETVLPMLSILQKYDPNGG